MDSATLFKGFLRLLTPEEISELTNSTNDESRIPLTDIMAQSLAGEELDFSSKESSAKILPFIQKKKENDVEVHLKRVRAGANVIDYFVHFYEMVEMGDTILKKDGTTNETSTFILNEKKRFEYSQANLKRREVLKLYKSNSKVDIAEERVTNKDLNYNSRSGVLINKKQY